MPGITRHDWKWLCKYLVENEEEEDQVVSALAIYFKGLVVMQADVQTSTRYVFGLFTFLVVDCNLTPC
jgi:hypothetical protein